MKTFVLRGDVESFVLEGIFFFVYLPTPIRPAVNS